MNKYNLKELLTSELAIETAGEILNIKFNGVQIPMIQRDYAQGRPSEKEIRERFLDAIFTALASGEGLELDFVYGSVKKYGESRYFIPLDGQQRLTTLFLLYWYAGQRETTTVEALSRNQQELARFSYDTRPTARKFCESLCAMPRIDFSITPSATIRNSGWFFNAYEKDPTVKAMLFMLDEIHILYDLKQVSILANLDTLKFYILPLDGFGLSDELYIKMNARGKQLSDFENFKADLIKWMKDDENPEAALFQQEVVYKSRQMPYYLAISLKLDNDWTNFFWEFTRDAEKEEDKLVDPLFLRFINRFLLNDFFLKSQQSQEMLEKSEEFTFFYSQDKKETPFEYTNFSIYQELIGSHAAIKRIEAVLDMVSVSYNDMSPILAPTWKPEEKWRFFDPEINQTQRILFLAICGYAERFPYEERSFKEWIRVVWNIINNPDIRSVPAMVTAMKLIHAMVPQANTIYTYLAGDAAVLLGLVHSNNTELSEERLKAWLIVQEPAWEAALVGGEAHGLFQGSIGFLLPAGTGLSDYDKRLALAKKLFGRSGPQRPYAEGHRLIRATISKIGNIHELLAFKMEDSERNWSLVLRRNKTVQRIICDFCSVESEAEMRFAIEAALTAPSQIRWNEPEAATGKIRHVHRQLYQQAAFYDWMHEKNAVDLSRRDETHFYIKRYRAWHDLVMLDTHRNELVARLLARFGLETDSRCGQTDFFKGSSVVLQKAADLTITLEFDPWDTLWAGLKKTNNYFEAGTPEELAAEANKDWHYVRAYSYIDIETKADMDALCERLKAEVFDVLQSIAV
jgi:hypothetical protein